MTSNNESHIKKLEDRIEVRNRKIADVQSRQIQNRLDFIAKIQKNIDRFQEHINRWTQANEKDLAKIQTLRSEIANDRPKDAEPVPDNVDHSNDAQPVNA